MRKERKRVLSLLLAIAMVAGMLVVPASAADTKSLNFTTDTEYDSFFTVPDGNVAAVETGDANYTKGFKFPNTSTLISFTTTGDGSLTYVCYYTAASKNIRVRQGSSNVDGTTGTSSAAGVVSTTVQLTTKEGKGATYDIKANNKDQWLLAVTWTPASTTPDAPLDTSSLTDAIAAAKAKVQGVAISADGTDVVPTKKWATADDIGAIQAAIADAESALKTVATDDEVAAAVAALDAAVEAFDPQDGTKEDTRDDDTKLADALEAVNGLLEAMDNTFDPAELESAADLVDVVKTALGFGADDTSITVDAATVTVTAGDYTAPEAGTKENPEGTAGSITCKVTVKVSEDAQDDVDVTVDLPAEAYVPQKPIVHIFDPELNTALSSVDKTGVKYSTGNTSSNITFTYSDNAWGSSDSGKCSIKGTAGGKISIIKMNTNGRTFSVTVPDDGKLTLVLGSAAGTKVPTDVPVSVDGEAMAESPFADATDGVCPISFDVEKGKVYQVGDGAGSYNVFIHALVWEPSDADACAHTSTTDGTAVAPTCGKAGYTPYYCNNITCFVVGTKNETPATGAHTYENGKCKVCGADEPVVPVTGVTLNKTSADVPQGETLQLTATVAPETATTKTVTWSVAPTDGKVTVSATGLVSVAADATGTYTVTATTEGKNASDEAETAQCVITVKKVVTALAFEHTDHEVFEEGNDATGGEGNLTPDHANKWQLKLNATPADHDNTITWTSTDATVATVSQTGLVTAAKAGTTTIKATADNGVEATMEITVSAWAKSVAITTPTDTTVKMGQTLTLAATVTGSANLSQKSVTWSSSDTTKATVDAASGKVTPVAPGEVTITATSTNNSAAKATQDLTIAKGEFTMTVETDHDAYAATDTAVVVTVEGAPEAELANVTVSAQTGSETAIDGVWNAASKSWGLTIPANTDAAAKTYTVTASHTASDNYDKAADATVDFTQNGTGTKTLKVSVAGAKDLTVGDKLELTATVTVDNAAPTEDNKITYQWKKGGTAIDGATASKLTIDSVAKTDAGSYTVTVSVAADSDITADAVTSTATAVTVSDPALTAIEVTGAGYDADTGKLTITGSAAATLTVAGKPDGNGDTVELVDDYNGDVVTVTLAGGQLTVTPKKSGTTTINLKGNPTTTVTKAISVEINKAPAPAKLTAAAVTVVDQTAADGKGKITPAASGAGYEYKAKTNGTWADLPDAGVEVNPGVYQVRVKVANTVFQAEDTDPLEVTVAAFTPVQPTTYTVTVTGGTADKATAAKGASVTITAGVAETGKVFDKWTATGITLSAEDAAKAVLTFTMPEGNVSFTATYKDATQEPDPDLGYDAGDAAAGRYVFDAASIEMSQVAKSDSDATLVEGANFKGSETETGTHGTNNYFTFHYMKDGAKFSKVRGVGDETEYVANDYSAAFTPTQYFDFGGKTDNGAKGKYMTFTTQNAGAKVGVFWATGGTTGANVSRRPAIVDLASSAAVSGLDGTPAADKTPHLFSEFTLGAAGTYNLGSLGNTVMFYKVVVLDAPSTPTATTNPTTPTGTPAPTATTDPTTPTGTPAPTATTNPTTPTTQPTAAPTAAPTEAPSVSGGGTAMRPTNTVTSTANGVTTVTNKVTGAVTETSKLSDGSKQVVVTEKDGTVTETVTKPDGSVSEVVTKPDGSSATTVVDTQGVKTETVTTAEGETTAKVTVPSKVDKAVVTVPKANVNEGTVPVIVNADGTEEIVKTSAPGEDGLDILVSGNATVVLKDNAKEFVDIPEGYWAKKAVDFSSSREIFKGTTETTFSPLEDVDRASLATALYRLEGAAAQGASAFLDVTSGDWYSDAVAWANKSGVVNGYADGNFGPKDKVTREQLATMLQRYAKLVGMDTSVKGNLEAYPDVSEVSSWATDAMAWAVGVGLINGTNDPVNGIQLSPAKFASRAEIATVMERMIKLMLK